MSYSYENLAVDKTKVNCVQKCFYIINLIKMKDHKKWEELKPHYDILKPEESYDFYQYLIEQYKALQSAPAAAKKTAAPKKKAPAKKAAAPKKKAPAKKAPAKKAAKKKVSKKPTKKK